MKIDYVLTSAARAPWQVCYVTPEALNLRADVLTSSQLAGRMWLSRLSIHLIPELCHSKQDIL